MEFLQTLLSFAPVTISSLIIVLALVVIACASVIFLKGVNFTLNSESWGKEVIDSWFVAETIGKIFFKEAEKWKYVSFSGNIYVLESENSLYFYRKYIDDTRWKYLGDDRCDEKLADNYCSKKEFNTKEEAYSWASDKQNLSNCSMGESRLPVKTYLLIPLIDLCLFTFTLAPLLTITVVSTATLVISVRWVSGKLANNVKNTDNNTKRIDNIEEKLKDE